MDMTDSGSMSSIYPSWKTLPEQCEINHKKRLTDVFQKDKDLSAVSVTSFFFFNFSSLTDT